MHTHTHVFVKGGCFAASSALDGRVSDKGSRATQHLLTAVLWVKPVVQWRGWADYKQLAEQA